MKISGILRRYACTKGSASDLIKELLAAYFSGELDAFNRPGAPVATEVIDERADAAMSKLLGLNFKGLDE